jgi:hypothetical protein
MRIKRLFAWIWVGYPVEPFRDGGMDCRPVFPTEIPFNLLAAGCEEAIRLTVAPI